MREFKARITIAAPVGRVWAVMADLERWPEWTASMTSIKLLDSRPPGPGSRVRVCQPGLLPARFVITRWEPARGFDWVNRQPGIVATGEHHLSPCSQGCDVTLVLRFEGWASGLVAALAGKLVERYVMMEAHGLKKRSEAQSECA